MKLTRFIYFKDYIRYLNLLNGPYILLLIHLEKRKIRQSKKKKWLPPIFQ